MGALPRCAGAQGEKHVVTHDPTNALDTSMEFKNNSWVSMSSKTFISGIYANSYVGIPVNFPDRFRKPFLSASCPEDCMCQKLHSFTGLIVFSYVSIWLIS